MELDINVCIGVLEETVCEAERARAMCLDEKKNKKIKKGSFYTYTQRTPKFNTLYTITHIDRLYTQT